MTSPSDEATNQALIAICGQKRREVAALAFGKQRNRNSAGFPNGSLKLLLRCATDSDLLEKDRDERVHFTCQRDRQLEILDSLE